MKKFIYYIYICSFFIVKCKYIVCSQQTEEVKIRGSIKSIVGDNIINAKISLKNLSQTIKLITDREGAFSTKLKLGIYLVKIKKAGYKTENSIIKIKDENSLEFTVEPNISSIFGKIVDEESIIKSVSIILKNNKDSIVEKYMSEDGNFYFNNIMGDLKYKIEVDKENYKNYESEVISSKKDIDIKHNIFLSTKCPSVVLEIESSGGFPISYEEVIINENLYSTDHNGILIIKLSNVINISIPAYNFKDNFVIEENGSIIEKKIIINL